MNRRPSSEEMMEIFDAENRECDASGTRTEFWDLGNGWGIRLMGSKARRDHAHKTQHDFSLYGRGPDVGEKVKIGDRYGYITEVVEVLTDEYARNNNHVNFHNWEFRESDELKEFLDVYKILTGGHYPDDHEGNFGYKDGRLVLIDFDSDVDEVKFNLAS